MCTKADKFLSTDLLISAVDVEPSYYFDATSKLGLYSPGSCTSFQNSNLVFIEFNS